MREVNAAPEGLLEINKHNKTRKDHYRTGDDGNERLFIDISPYDDIESEECPTVEFHGEWGEWVDEHGGSVAAAVVHHLRWVIGEHEKMLAEVQQRLHDRGLLANGVAKLHAADGAETEAAACDAAGPLLSSAG